MKNLLLTGATGFLGSHLVAALKDKYRLIVLKRSTSNLVRIQKSLDHLVVYDVDRCHIQDIFEDFDIHGVVHCATNYGLNDVDLLDTIEANLTLPLQLLKASIQGKVRFFLNTDTVLDKRISYYSLSKSHFKDWLKFFGQEIKVINMELEHFYGAGDNPTKFVTKMVTSLIGDDRPSLDLTLGEQKRSFVYIDDVIRAFEAVLDHIDEMPDGFNTVQVASSDQISIREFVELVKRLCENTKTELNFGAIPYRANEAMELDLDLSAIQRLGWREAYSLEDGVKKTIQDTRNLMNHSSDK